MGIVLRHWLDSHQVVVCRQCRTHLTSPEEVMSTEFQGQHGRAYLYATVINVMEAKEMTKTMTTGDHVIADIFCVYCRTKLGWKYIKAYEPSQRYKVGHYILERALVSEMDQPMPDVARGHIIGEHRHHVSMAHHPTTTTTTLNRTTLLSSSSTTTTTATSPTVQ